MKRAPFVKQVSSKRSCCTNLDKYELIDFPMEQHDDSSQEHSGVGLAPTLDTSASHCVKGVLVNRTVNFYWTIKTVALTTDSNSSQLEDLFEHAQAKIDPL